MFNPIKTTQADVLSDIDACVTRAWLDLVASDYGEQTGDDWLYLCDDIDQGEIYREWFLWEDQEVTQQWEAYDPVTNERFVAPDVSTLKTLIDQIEESRHPVPEYLMKVAV